MSSDVRARALVYLLQLGIRAAPLMRAGRLLFALLCLLTLSGCSVTGSADNRTIPLSPILTSLRPVTLDGTEGAWMDRDAQALAAWIADVEAAR